jgi:HAD superfamily hydrolase (TIGR01509 family)
LISIRAVLFDLDGVLIDSGPAHAEAWARFAGAEGVALPPAFFAETFGLPNARILPRLFRGRALGPAELRALGERKEAIFREIAGEHLAWLPGAEALLEDLAAAGVPRGLFSSTPRSNLDFLDARLRLSARLPVILSGDDVAEGKPAPDGWLALAARLGMPPAACVVLEDAPGGLRGARAAGCRAIGFATSHPAPELVAAGAERVVEGPRALAGVAVADWLAG